MVRRMPDHQRYPKDGIGVWQTLLPYADCGQRAISQRSHWPRANDHVAASKPRGGDTARRNSENILRISRARPGRRPVRLETRWRGRADVAWDWNLTDLVGLGPVILKVSPAGPGAGWARRRRLGQAPSAGPGSTPPPRVDPTRKNRWI